MEGPLRTGGLEMALPISPLPELDVCAFGSQGQLLVIPRLCVTHQLKGEEGKSKVNGSRTVFHTPVALHFSCNSRFLCLLATKLLRFQFLEGDLPLCLVGPWEPAASGHCAPLLPGPGFSRGFSALVGRLPSTWELSTSYHQPPSHSTLFLSLFLFQAFP